jgi:hypothetical protein
VIFGGQRSIRDVVGLGDVRHGYHIGELREWRVGIHCLWIDTRNHDKKIQATKNKGCNRAGRENVGLEKRRGESRV